MQCDFSLRHYEECLALANRTGYRFFRFDEYAKLRDQEKVVLMRHDVDVQVDIAVEMATIEQSLGATSTFFFRLHGQYNIFNVHTYRKIRRIVDMGHEIGLHFEPDFSVLHDRDTIEDIRLGIRCLESLFGLRVRSISPHEPTRTGSLYMDEKVLAQIGAEHHAYQDKFVKNMKYISDSSLRWREGCMHEWFERQAPRLCILTHPLWWFRNSPIENY